MSAPLVGSGRDDLHGAGGGTQTRTELSLLRILSRLTITKKSLFYWLYFHKMRKCVSFCVSIEKNPTISGVFSSVVLYIFFEYRHFDHPPFEIINTAEPETI
jgi:hypothetical protein